MTDPSGGVSAIVFSFINRNVIPEAILSFYNVTHFLNGTCRKYIYVKCVSIGSYNSCRFSVGTRVRFVTVIYWV